ncbi:MAG: SpoIIE family protein phosphatase [Phycisphaerae bacterium]|nr:SpoIIE family protein phosphatase [Phycisphaerae bacterium]
MSFRLKLFVAFFGIGAVLVAMTLWQVYRLVHRLPTTITAENLVCALPNAAGTLDPQQVVALSKALQSSLQAAEKNEPGKPFHETRAFQTYCRLPQFIALRKQLEAVDRAAPHFGPDQDEWGNWAHLSDESGYEKNIYILVRSDTPEKGRCLVSLIPADVGRLLDMTRRREMMQGWIEPVAEQSIVTDEQGPSLGAWGPIRDDKGNVVALLAIIAPGNPLGQYGARIIQLAVEIFLVTAVVAALLALYYSWRLNRPIGLLTRGMQLVRSGRQDPRIPSERTHDEFESLIARFNEMVDGLGERDRLQQSLVLAHEIQRHLLPQRTPELAGFDVFGDVRYCDETGGDYYDFIDVMDVSPTRAAVAVGDVSGHGIGAALLMTSARAALRSFAHDHRRPIDEIMADVNAHLARDTARGRFMTLLYVVLDAQARAFHYASAGHDPALWYHAKTSEIDRLDSTGIPLGIDLDARHGQVGPLDLDPGDVLVMSTDGIREARSPDDEIFGLERLGNVIRSNADCSAKEIHQAVIDAVDAFQSGTPPDDDISLAIIRVWGQTPFSVPAQRSEAGTKEGV